MFTLLRRHGRQLRGISYAGNPKITEQFWINAIKHMKNIKYWSNLPRNTLFVFSAEFSSWALRMDGLKRSIHVFILIKSLKLVLKNVKKWNDWKFNGMKRLFDGMKIVRNLSIIFGKDSFVHLLGISLDFIFVEFAVQNCNHSFYPMVNTTNSFDQISNVLIDNVLYVQQPVIRQVLSVYWTILTNYVLIKIHLFFKADLMCSFLFFSTTSFFLTLSFADARALAVLFFLRLTCVW